MKFRYNIIIVFLTFSLISASATVINGKVAVLVNDGTNFKIMLQVNTDSESSKMGGATFVMKYDTTHLAFPDSPIEGTDYTFSNFNLGYYDTATVTQPVKGELWLNIDLTSDNHGTLVQMDPGWTNLVVLTFTSSQVVSNDLVSWKTNSRFWHVYDEDNTSSWGKGSFGMVTVINENNTSADPFTYSLSQNFPNPFNPATMIQYNVPERSIVKLTVYNIIGEEVRVLAEGEKEAGFYTVNFKANDLPSGVYIYRLNAGSFVETRKMILLK